MSPRAFVLMVLLAALRPFTNEPSVQHARGAFPGWPSEFEGKSLVELPLSAREQGFVADFPGEVGRFSDGDREIIIRWIEKESRKLHPAADCFKGAGYEVTPLPIQKDGAGQTWGCFAAQRDLKNLSVCEQIRDQTGQTWSDVSSWFWAAFLGRTSGPWWAVTKTMP